MTEQPKKEYPEYSFNSVMDAFERKQDIIEKRSWALAELDKWLNQELSFPYIDHTEFKILIRVRNKISELLK